jgi:signal transduction histidine kinase
MGRVILNIVNNAFQACFQQSESLKLESQIDYKPLVVLTTHYVVSLRLCEIHIQDNGPGIPTHIKDKIFQPFFTNKPTGQGTGLGLSLAYDIVKAHGGKIEVNTHKIGGTEFKIILPI